MKKNLQPEVYAINAHCACGKEFTTESTRPDIRVTLCSNCHPFFTGATKFVDTAGRIEKFEKKYKKGNKA
ncbi:MAG: 50S ribosomal protein L31 [Candidatus Babeliaceae bacterium]|jgi:large subunit ribosomal protein L31